MTSEPQPSIIKDPADEPNARLLQFKQGIQRGDPTAVYQAVLLCADHDVVQPQWLTEHILNLIANYHLGKKPSWKGKGRPPLTVIRRRLEDDVRRRAVKAVELWAKDKSQYQALTTNCIKAWNRQDYTHKSMTTQGRILDFASYGLEGVHLKKDGKPIKCSTRTLRRLKSLETKRLPPPLPSRIADVFGLVNPDTLFGTKEPLKPYLK